MAGTHFSLTASGFDALRQRVQVMAGLDTSALMPQLGEYLLASTQERFTSQTGPDGNVWQALQPRALKRKKYNKDKVLTLHGFLRKNLRYQILDKTTVQIGSHLEYAATHQYGRAAISARPFLGLSSQDHQEIRAIIQDWAAELGFK